MRRRIRKPECTHSEWTVEQTHTVREGGDGPLRDCTIAEFKARVCTSCGHTRGTVSSGRLFGPEGSFAVEVLPFGANWENVARRVWLDGIGACIGRYAEELGVTGVLLGDMHFADRLVIAGKVPRHERVRYLEWLVREKRTHAGQYLDGSAVEEYKLIERIIERVKAEGTSERPSPRAALTADVEQGMQKWAAERMRAAFSETNTGTVGES